MTVFISVHTDVNYNRTLFNHITGDKFSFSDGGYQYIRSFGDFGKIFCLRVTYGYRSVCVKQKHSLRLSYYIASSDNDTFLAGNVDTRFLYKLHNSGGSAGKKVIVAYHDFSHILGSEGVNVFFLTYCVDDFFLVNMGGEGKLYQYPVNGVGLI